MAIARRMIPTFWNVSVIVLFLVLLSRCTP
jgi:hypothetical protein